MKKSFLFIIVCVISAAASGQQAPKGSVFSDALYRDAQPYHGRKINVTPAPSALSLKNTGRTTSPCTSCGRWYDYGDSIFALNESLINPTTSTSINIWWDTTAIFGNRDGTYSTTIHPYGSDFTSVGLNFQPWVSAWNLDSTFSFTEPAVTMFDAYTIDEVSIAGFYGRNPAKPSIADTLIVQVVIGDGSDTSNLPNYLSYADSVVAYPGIGIGPLLYQSLLYDSLNNRAGAANGFPLTVSPWYNPALPLTTNTYKYILTEADTITVGTAGPGGTLNKTYPRAGHVPADPAWIPIHVPAGNFAALTVSFRSGNPALTHVFLHDTVDYATTGVYKYGSYSPVVIYESDGGTGAAFPPFVNYPPGTDWTSGYFDLKGNRGDGPDREYIPNWAWTAGTGVASSLQYPAIWFHIQCPFCSTVGSFALGVSTLENSNSVKVYPNPGSNELNISYTLAQSSTVMVTLTNMLGQVVASQKINDATSGKAVFTTSALPSGVYIYSLDANGERLTGRVEIAH